MCCKKRVLVLTASYGSGHNTAARFTAAALSELYGSEIDVKIIDLLDLLPRAVVKLTRFFYEVSMLHVPIAWDMLFIVTNRIFYLFPMLKKFLVCNAGRIKKILQGMHCSIYVSTHPYWHNIISKCREGGKKYIVIVTDAIAIHPVWVAEDVDFYIVFDEDTARVLMYKYKVDENKIKILGFPVDPLLEEKMDRAGFLSGIGLERDRFTVLFNFGLGSLYNYLLAFYKLVYSGNHKLQFICITGRHRRIYDLLSGRCYPCPVKIVGWTDKMADYVRASDVVITKAGGGIVMESLLAMRPPIILSFPPGQERGNVMLIEKHDIGVYQRDVEEAVKIVHQFSMDRSLLEEKKRNMGRVVRSSPAYNIARFIYENM
jgi:UDP-N-acetylglucosamine:LPS N-acetylglucosamine transferase